MNLRAAFELPLVVASEDIDTNGHVNNVVYLGWVQDVAIAHWRAAIAQKAWPRAKEIAWVVRKHAIEYLRPAFAGEALLARTWAEPAGAATFHRHTEISRPADDQLLARAESLWVVLDARSGRPRRLDAELRALFAAPK
ncbi:MAG: acyl-CoA thioesterase [Verrucomicrobia bacterium]|nr:acyl-CoA thioesterase [Verrucomicrobiota bacterium]